MLLFIQVLTHMLMFKSVLSLIEVNGMSWKVLLNWEPSVELSWRDNINFAYS